jgi:diguanylate cyclase (GGDEF)-like protein/hemerythrin-like metal-binding protein
LFHHHRSDGTPYPGDECPIRRTLEDGQLRRVENEWFWRKDGSGFPVALTITPIVENDRRVGVVVIFQDTTERMADEAKIRDLAFYDPLTRLPNRRLLLDRLEQTMAASQRSGCYGALMFLDLDNFKPLNDTHGHAIGDMLLVEAANRLKGCVREVDTVARFGGDEFVVLLGELSADRAATTSQAELIAEKIRNALSAPYRLTITREGAADATVEHRCTATIGVALFINHEMSQDEILTKADDAMYQAKEAGRNRVQFSAAKFLRSAGSETVSANFVQLTWRPAYRSGNPLIDEQHRALLSDANSLLTAILSTRPTAEVAALIDVLIGDIVEHFKDEEAIILAAGFPGTEQHAAIHRELVDRAGNLVGRFHAGTLGVGDLFEFLANDVIAQHMLGADREYFSYMEKRH